MINAKKAKRLRREARALTKGQPRVAHHGDIFMDTTFRWLGTTGTVRLADTCTRAVYQQLKRGKLDFDTQLAALMHSAPVAEVA